MITILSMLRD